MRNFLKEIRERILIYDGSKGVMLQRSGMQGGECPELWNITHREEIKKIYSLYKQAGADVIQTNTFQGNRRVLEKYSLAEKVYELNFEGTRLAREVMGRDGFVAASIGPIGRLLAPSGDLTFEEAYDVYKEQVVAVADGGADVINFETFTDIAELRIALLAAKEATGLPVICSAAFEATGRTLMGTDPYTAAVTLKSLGADLVGANCSFGPEHMLDIVRKMGGHGNMLLSVKPNAGLPEIIEGESVYCESPEKFAVLSREFVRYGGRLIGGCCGTTPEYIKAIKEILSGMEAPRLQGVSELQITSNTKLLNVERTAKLKIGHIDAYKDAELAGELGKGNMDFLTDAALDLADEGYDAFYINVDKIMEDGLLLAETVDLTQGYIREPFILESGNAEALKHALRIYRGKAGVVVNGYPSEVMEELLYAAKKYGSAIVDRNLIG